MARPSASIGCGADQFNYVGHRARTPATTLADGPGLGGSLGKQLLQGGGVEPAGRTRSLAVVLEERLCLDEAGGLLPGFPGMRTPHSNSAPEAVGKICTLPLLSDHCAGC